jgi:hypothetical protein
MKPASEVAEEIYIPWNTNDDQYRAECRKAIAKALIAFAEERVLEAFDNKFKNEHKRCLEIARAEALEEAANLFHNPKINVPIRALKEKP